MVSRRRATDDALVVDHDNTDTNFFRLNHRNTALGEEQTRNKLSTARGVYESRVGRININWTPSAISHPLCDKHSVINSTCDIVRLRPRERLDRRERSVRQEVTSTTASREFLGRGDRVNQMGRPDY